MPSGTKDDVLEKNKQTVIAAFYDLMVNQCQPAEAITSMH